MPPHLPIALQPSTQQCRVICASCGKARRSVSVHGLRSAITPIVTIFGLDVGLLLGSAVLTEVVFGFVGIGKLSIIAIGSRDLPVVLGVTLFAAFFVVVANIIVDVAYALLDPRVTLS